VNTAKNAMAMDKIGDAKESKLGGASGLNNEFQKNNMAN
jgi:hypothetical protein